MKWIATIKRSNRVTGVEQAWQRRTIEADTESQAREQAAVQVQEMIETAARRFRELGASPREVRKCVEAESVEVVSISPLIGTAANFIDTRTIEINGQRMDVDMLKLLEVAGFDDTLENRDLVVALLEEEVAGGTTDGANTHQHQCVGCRQLFAHAGKRKKCKLPRKAWCEKCRS